MKLLAEKAGHFTITDEKNNYLGIVRKRWVYAYTNKPIPINNKLGFNPFKGKRSKIWHRGWNVFWNDKPRKQREPFKTLKDIQEKYEFSNYPGYYWILS